MLTIRIAACSVVIAALISAGCKQQEARTSRFEKDAKRLAHELSLAQQENAQLQASQASLLEDNRALRAQINGLQLQLARLSTPATTVHHHHAVRQTDRQTSPTGDWILICSSVGKSHADKQRPLYEKMVDRYNRDFGTHGQHFGVRDLPESGGVQFIFGITAGGLGMDKDTVLAVQRDLKARGRFSDCYLKRLR